MGGLRTTRPIYVDQCPYWATRAASSSDWYGHYGNCLCTSTVRPLSSCWPHGFDRFARYAEAMLDEREFFIRKAIGWVLRETGKHRPDEVFEWLLPKAHRASGVTVREAVKYLPAEQRQAVLAAR